MMRASDVIDLITLIMTSEDIIDGPLFVQMDEEVIGVGSVIVGHEYIALQCSYDVNMGCKMCVDELIKMKAKVGNLTVFGLIDNMLYNLRGCYFDDDNKAIVLYEA